MKGVIYMILHIWQAFRLSGTTFVRKVCMKLEYVCKPVFCEHNLPVEATYIHVTKLGRKGPMTCFTNIHIIFFVTTWPNQMGSSLNCKKNCHSFLIRFDFSDSIKGSFAIDTQIPIVIFWRTICISIAHYFFFSLPIRSKSLTSLPASAYMVRTI